MSRAEGPTSAVRPRWSASQLALVTTMACLASLWLRPVTPVPALYLAVVTGATVGAVPSLRGWRQPVRLAAIVVGALVVLALGAGPGIAVLLVYLVAIAASTLTVRLRSPLIPVTSTLVLMVVGVLTASRVEPAWFVRALGYSACALLFGTMRQLTLTPRLSVRRDPDGVVRPRRRRRVTVPMIGIVAASGLVVAAVVPFADGDSRPRPLARSWTAAQQRLPAPTGEGLPGWPDARPMRAALPTSTGELTPGLARFAVDIARDPGSAVGLETLARHLREDVTTRAGPPERVVMSDLEQVLRVRAGTAYEKAMVFAAAARGAGFFCRVVPGHLRTAADDDTGAGPRQRWVYHPHTWAEVLIEDVGWVTFHTTTIADVRATQQPLSSLVQASRAGPVWAGATPGRRLELIASSAASSVLLRGAAALLAVALGLALAAALVTLVVGPPLSATLRRLRRHRRLRHGDPAQRIAGAWRETVDLLRLRRLPVSPASTTHDIAIAVHAAFDGAAANAIDALATVVSDACFAPRRPTPDDASRALELEGAARHHLLLAATPWQRLRILFDPRPLWWDRGRPSPAAVAADPHIR